MEKFSGSMEFSASAEETVALVATEGYMRRRYEEPDLVSFELDVQKDDEDEFECTMLRTFSLGEGVPKVIRRVVGKQFTLRQEHYWERQGPPYHSSGRLSVNGAPGEVNVNVTVEPLTDQTCKLSYSGTIKAGVPLIGGQIERFLLDRVDQSVEASFAAMARALKE